jgi:hypothetical protein
MTRILRLADSMAIHNCTGWGNSNELHLRRLWSGYHAERPWFALPSGRPQECPQASQSNPVAGAVFCALVVLSLGSVGS